MKNQMFKTNDRRALAVARISSRRQEGGISFDTQDDCNFKHASLHGLEVVKSFKIIESAKSSGARIKFKQILTYANKNKIKHIIFYQFDRETRNLSDNESNEKLIRSGDLIIHYSRENKIFDTNTPDSDFFMRDVSAATNRQFIRVLSGKVIDAMAKKAEMGHYPGNRPPLGYIQVKPKGAKRGSIVTPDPNHKIIQIVQKEFQLRAEGLSYDAIKQSVFQSGLLNGLELKGYSKNGIEKRLKNVFYRGRFVWRDKTYDGQHELIIPIETLKAVDATFDLKAKYGRRITAVNAVFSGGWLRCSDCGCQIVYDPKVKRNSKTDEIKTFHYYHCSNGKKIHKKQVNMSDERIWKQFESALDVINIPESFAKKIAFALNESYEATKAATHRQLEDCRTELDKVDRRREAVIDIYAAHELEKEDYLKQMERFRNERNYTAPR